QANQEPVPNRCCPRLLLRCGLSGDRQTAGLFADFRPVQTRVAVEKDAIIAGVATIAGAVALAQTAESRIRHFGRVSRQREVSHVIPRNPDPALDAFAADML